MEIHPNKCKVIIEGLSPGILLDNPQSLLEKTGIKKIKSNPEEEAASRLYWTSDKKSIAFPAFNFYKGLVQAGAGWKCPLDRKRSLPSTIAGDMSIEPVMIPFNTKKYQIDIRRATIQGQGIALARPLLFPWQLKFTIKWNSQYLGTDDFTQTVLPDLLEQLGHAIGIGNFRPKKSKGPFGRFDMKEIKT